MNVQAAEQAPVRILLIEEDNLEHQLLLDQLEHRGYSVCSLASHRALPEVIVSFRPHLILLNVGTPSVDSYDRLRQIRQHEEWLHVPVVVVSSLAFQADLQQAMYLGANRYLVKPIDFEELDQVIREEVQNLVAFPH